MEQQIIIHTDEDGSYQIAYQSNIALSIPRGRKLKILNIGFYFWLIVSIWLTFGALSMLFVSKQLFGLGGLVLLVLSYIRLYSVNKHRNAHIISNMIQNCNTYFNKAEFHNALALMKKIVSKAPSKYIELYGNLAYLYFINEMKDNAVETLYTALDLSGGKKISNITRI